MEITEIRIKLTDGRDEKLRAFCSITLDDRFVIRDLKLIEGKKGLFLAMPSRKLADRCPGCGAKNHLQASYCNECGARLDPGRAPRDSRGRPRLHIDIAHPINSSCREHIQKEVVAAFHRELDRRSRGDYVEPDFDDFLFDLEEDGGDRPGAGDHAG